MSARRSAIVERDGAECVWCGRAPWPRDLTLEHLLPRSRGGRATPANLTPACRSCNRARRSRPVAAYVRELMAAGRAPRLR
ncbi:MAG TPA: HNH endonuclease, partial [Thermoleophilaceae bacterium]